jgi:hypothetical protein
MKNEVTPVIDDKQWTNDIHNSSIRGPIATISLFDMSAEPPGKLGRNDSRFHDELFVDPISFSASD